ncbi:MAG: protein kinase, partial [Acidobacteria bacterium]|nr:protein kinase [Acidobacteriota bacterium]
MTRCPSCSARISPSAERCPSCETPLPAGATKTVEVPGPGIRAPGPEAGAGSSVDGGRFVPGTVLAGRYRVSGLLGVGGMGEVYRAEDLKLGEAVALKFLPEGLHLDGAALARLHREVRLARRIAHRSVCRVYDIGETGGLHYVTMELIDGEDLASLLRRIGRLPKDKAVELSRQICVGLAAAHDAGILHRDLKPSNIMVDGEGRARISDFGLASLEAETGDDVFAGTPEYMAPEQLERGEVSTRSDLYALGLVLYEMFTGR